MSARRSALAWEENARRARNAAGSECAKTHAKAVEKCQYALRGPLTQAAQGDRVNDDEVSVPRGSFCLSQPRCKGRTAPAGPRRWFQQEKGIFAGARAGASPVNRVGTGQ